MPVVQARFGQAVAAGSGDGGFHEWTTVPRGPRAAPVPRADSTRGRADGGCDRGGGMRTAAGASRSVGLHGSASRNQWNVSAPIFPLKEKRKTSNFGHVGSWNWCMGHLTATSFPYAPKAGDRRPIGAGRQGVIERVGDGRVTWD